MQGCRVFVRADVARDQVQRRDRHVELRLLGILDGEELHRMAVDGERLEPAVAADAVVDMHHRRSDVEFDEVLDHEVGIDGAPLGAFHRCFAAVSEDLRLGDERMIPKPVAALDGRDGHRQRVAAGFLKGGEAVDVVGANALAEQEVVQVDAPPGGLRGEQHPRARVGDEGAQARRRIGGAVVGGDVRQLPAAEADAVPMLLPVRIQPCSPVFLQLRVQVGRAQEQAARRQDRPLWIVAQVFVARRHVVQVLLGRAGGIGFEHEHRALREIVEQRRRAWRVGAGRPVAEEERQVVLDALGDDAGAHVLVDAALADVGVEGAVPGVAEAGDSGGVHGDFPRRQDAHLRGFGVGALGIGVEQAQGIDFVVEQVDAHRIGGAHREDVQERSAHGELAAFGDRVGCAVSCRD